MKTSEKVGLIFEAQINMQATLTDVGKDKEGYGYKYASFDSIVQHLRPLLAAQGLGFIQTSTSDGDYIGVTTRLIHKSGEWVEDTFTMPLVTLAKMNNYQVAGSAITYLKRYGLSAIVGIAVDEDIDASGEQEKPKPPQPQPKAPPQPRKINQIEGENLMELIEKTNTDIEKFCANYKIKTIGDLTLVHYQDAMKILQVKVAKNA